MPEPENYKHYQVLRRDDGSLWELGRGAMGITYKAYDTNLHCAVALKVINATYLGSDIARQRFLREARAAAALRHQNVASIFNLSTDQDNYFYVMEFIDGQTVEAYVKQKGRLEPAEALNITLQVARALGAADKQRLVHRDLKPANLMLVDEEGEKTVVKVIDFGLAKSAKDGGEDTGTLTMQGFVGTPHFASPEQVEEGDLDVRSDIYSLGATLYYMLAGKPPFSGSIGQIMSQHLYKPIPVDQLADVPSCVVSLLKKMLEKDRTQRPQTPRDLQMAIADCLEEIRLPVSNDLPAIDETAPLSVTAGALVGRKYRLIEQFRESPQGRYFVGEDLSARRLVSLLFLNQELVSDPHWFTAFKTSVDRVLVAPHPALRRLHSLDKIGGENILVEEHVSGPSLRDLLRSRRVFTAQEVVRLLSLLAPLADHATAQRLDHIEMTLLGVHFVVPESPAHETQLDLFRQPLTEWEQVDPKVNAIDFSFKPSQGSTLSGMETITMSDAGAGSGGSHVRGLSLLVYELLGGQRARVETTGQYHPIASLTQEGNAVLRRGLTDQYSTAAELAVQLAAEVPVRESSTAGIQTTERIVPEQPAQTLAAEAAVAPPSQRTSKVTRWLPITVIGLIVIIGAGGYVIFSNLNQTPKVIPKPAENHPTPAVEEVATLTIVTTPPGASVLLDGKPAQSPPNTFTHIPFGTHELTATFDNYESVKQEIQVHAGMPAEIHLTLNPEPEIAALSVQSDPPGATILLDGQPPQTPPNTFTHVPFGAHELTATLDSYEPVTQKIEVQRGMAPEIHLKLNPKTEIAALTVRSDPPGAKVLLDGKPPGTPPNIFTHIPFGVHQLTAALDNYESVKQDIQVQSGMASEIHIKLNPVSIDALLAEAKKYEEGSNEQVNAYVRIVQFATATGAANGKDYTNQLSLIIEKLRTKTPPITQDEFNIFYEESVKQAADLNVLPAILWLAENAKSDEALPLFLRAAKLGDSYAMMKAGRLYLRKGTPTDNEEGFKWLNLAYNGPNRNLEAGAYIGDCYLSGRGTQPDLQKAEDIIMPLANQNVVPAMTIAGRILEVKSNSALTEAGQAGTSPERRKQLDTEAAELARQARTWYERAVAKGDWNASAHLGYCYQLGWGGVQKSEEEAEKRYKEGATHGNAISMFFYGLLIEKKPGRRSEAEKLISGAAAVGVPSAIKWCKENNVSFTLDKAEE